MMVSIEQHVDFVTDAIAYLREHGLATIEPTAEAEEAWVDHVREDGEADALPAGEVVVHGRQRARQAARAPALRRRRRHVPRGVRADRRGAATTGSCWTAERPDAVTAAAAGPA